MVGYEACNQYAFFIAYPPHRLHNICYIIRYQKRKRCNAVIAMDSAFLVPARCYILYIMTVWYQFCGFAPNLFPSLRHRIATGQPQDKVGQRFQILFYSLDDTPTPNFLHTVQQHFIYILYVLIFTFQNNVDKYGTDIDKIGAYLDVLGLFCQQFGF